MANTQKPEVSPEALNEAKSLWHNFIVASKWGIILIVILLILMAIFLV